MFLVSTHFVERFLLLQEKNRSNKDAIQLLYRTPAKIVPSLTLHQGPMVYLGNCAENNRDTSSTISKVKEVATDRWHYQVFSWD